MWEDQGPSPLKSIWFFSDQRKYKLSSVYKHLAMWSVPTSTEDVTLLIILLVNKSERDHKDWKKEKKQETLICKCVISGGGGKSVSDVDKVLGRRPPVLFALQIK